MSTLWPETKKKYKYIIFVRFSDYVNTIKSYKLSWAFDIYFQTYNINRVLKRFHDFYIILIGKNPKILAYFFIGTAYFAKQEKHIKFIKTKGKETEK